MNEKTQYLLEQILTAQVLLLAKTIKAGKNTTSDCTDEAIKLMHHKRAEILRQLEQMP